MASPHNPYVVRNRTGTRTHNRTRTGDLRVVQHQVGEPLAQPELRRERAAELVVEAAEDVLELGAAGDGLRELAVDLASVHI